MLMCTGAYACAPNHHKMKYKCCMRLVLGVRDNRGTNHYHLLTVYYMLGAVLSTWYAWSQFNPHNNPVRSLHVKIQSPQRLKKWLKVTVLESDRQHQDWTQEHFDSKSPYSVTEETLPYADISDIIRVWGEESWYISWASPIDKSTLTKHLLSPIYHQHHGYV